MFVPQNTVLKANSSQLIGAIINDMGVQELKNAAPNLVNGTSPTVEDIRAVGNIVLNDKVVMNAFIDTLVNRIGKVVIQSRLYRNPWNGFKAGYMELGDVIEEIYVRLLKPHEFNQAESENTLFRREIPEALTAFHRINFKKFYKVTISMLDLRAAFTTWDGMYDLTNRIIEQTVTSANYDEFIIMKYLIAKAILTNNFHFVEIPEVIAANAEDITTELIATSNALTFMSADYNAMGVETYSDKSSQITIINTRYSALQNVKVLASAFNMDKADLEGNVTMVNTFGFNRSEKARLRLLTKETGENIDKWLTDTNLQVLDSIPAITVDKSFFMIVDNYYGTESVRNGEGLYYNYLLHTWKIISYSPFANAVLYTSDNNLGTVTSVTIFPSAGDSLTVQKGKTVAFTAAVESNGIVDSGVTWSVDSTVSTIDNDGILTVDSAETKTKLTVTATAKADSTKTATVSVTVQT